MATIKSYTDIEQSKKLAKILPLESADMYYSWIGTAYLLHAEPYNEIIAWRKEYAKTHNNPSFCTSIIPCWSLATLLEQFPYELCDDDGNSLYLQINKEDDVYQLVYTDPYGDFESIETDRYEHFVDACYEMIIKLNELNLL